MKIVDMLGIRNDGTVGDTRGAYLKTCNIIARCVVDQAEQDLYNNAYRATVFAGPVVPQADRGSLWNQEGPRWLHDLMEYVGFDREGEWR